MNWDALGAIAETLGAIAVFLTLIYLTLQIRQNTQAVRASAMNASVGHIATIRRDIYATEEIADLYMRGNADPHALSPLELLRYRTLVHNMINSQANSQAQARYAGLPESAWESQAPILRRVLSSPGGAWFWENFGSEFEESFRAEIDEILARRE